MKLSSKDLIPSRDIWTRDPNLSAVISIPNNNNWLLEEMEFTVQTLRSKVPFTANNRATTDSRGAATARSFRVICWSVWRARRLRSLGGFRWYLEGRDLDLCVIVGLFVHGWCVVCVILQLYLDEMHSKKKRARGFRASGRSGGPQCSGLKKVWGVAVFF